MGFSTSLGLKGKIFFYWFYLPVPVHWKLMRSPETPSTGMQRVPDWNSFHLPLWAPSLELVTENAKSLIVQLYSQDKLTTPRHENREIGHENKILKANEPAPYVKELQINRMTSKNIPQNLVILSREVVVRTHFSDIIVRKFVFFFSNLQLGRQSADSRFGKFAEHKKFRVLEKMSHILGVVGERVPV
jgi:hypothetical protein